MPAADDGDVGVAACPRQCPEPRIRDPVGQQEIAREPILGSWPTTLVGAEPMGQQDASVEQRSFAEILLLTSWKDRALFSVSQAGMVNNLNDGMAWGLFPLYFASKGLSLERISFLAARGLVSSPGTLRRHRYSHR